MRKLKVHDEKNYLMWEDGTPFYYLADTAWELAHKLNKSEAQYYLSVRKNQGFNVIQIVALPEFDGLRTRNAYGHRPLEISEKNVQDFKIPKSKPNYWTDLDDIIKMAQDMDLFIALLPTWGDKFNKKQGSGPEIFNEQNAYEYGKWLGTRYSDYWNIIWVLGGDRPLETKVHKLIIDKMAAGLREGDQGSHLMTYHPSGAASSVDFVSGKEYIDFHSIQSGHGMECYDSWRMVGRTKKTENKPCIDLEPRYERFPACFKPEIGYEWDTADIRQNNYWNMMEGVCGHTYGHRAVWCFNHVAVKDNPYSWYEALMEEGALQMQYLKQLRLSRPYFELRNADELLKIQENGMGHQCAARGEAYVYIYSPLGTVIHTDLHSFHSYSIKASWFNPRTGMEKVFGIVNSDEAIFVPPSSGKGNDWVLILDKL